MDPLEPLDALPPIVVKVFPKSLTPTTYAAARSALLEIRKDPSATVAAAERESNCRAWMAPSRTVSSCSNLRS